MKCLKQVRTNEFAFGRDNEILSTSGVGSCVVIIIWDKCLKISALSHISSPTNIRLLEEIGICPTPTVSFLLNYFKQKGSFLRNLEISIIGGGDMFNLGEGDYFKTGDEIIKEIKEILKDNNVINLYEDTGGGFGRKVELLNSCGQVKVLNTNGDIRIFNADSECINC